MTLLDPFLNDLIALAQQVGSLIKEIYAQGPAPDILLGYKEDGSPFTQADQEADHVIQKRLRELTPHIPIISEEQPPYVLDDLEAPFWLIDPLDGTKGFIERSGEFVVNIALIERRRPVLGLIHVPLSAETYLAFQHQAYVIKEEKIEILNPLLCPEGEWNAIIGHSCIDKTDTPERMRQQFPLQQIRRMGSALKFCLFARGEAHFSWRFSPCYEWDTAAAQALIETLGGCFITLKGDPLLYGKPNYLNREGFFVYGPKELQHFTPIP